MLKITRRVGLLREREIKLDVVSKKGQVELSKKGQVELARRVKFEDRKENCKSFNFKVFRQM